MSPAPSLPPLPSLPATARTEDQATTVVRNSADNRVIGGMLLTFGTGWLLKQTGVGLSWTAIFAAVLLSLGVGMMVTPRGGQGVRLWILGLVLTLGLASMSSVSAHIPGGGIGETVYTPRTLSEVRSSYEQAGGEMTLDFSNVDFEDDTKVVKARLGGGELTVVVPDDVRVEVVGRVIFGELSAFGEQIGAGAFQTERRTYRQQGFAESRKKLTLDLDMVAGQVSIVRAVDRLAPPSQPNDGFGFKFEVN